MKIFSPESPASLFSRSSSDSLLAEAKTLHPMEANSSAVAFPIPELAPVIHIPLLSAIIIDFYGILNL